MARLFATGMFDMGRNRRLRADDSVVPASGHPAQRFTLALMRLGFVAVSVVGLALLSASLWRNFIAIDALKLTTVQVRGAQRTNKEALLAAAGTQYGDALMALDLRRAAFSMTQLPWVRTATLRRQLPNRLHIDVQEHSPKALVMLNNLWVVNTWGEPFKPFTSDDGLGLPVITGVAAALGLAPDLAADGAAEEGSLEMAPLPDTADEAIAHSGLLTRALALTDAVHAAYPGALQVEQVHVDEDLGFSLYLRPCTRGQDVANDLRPVLVHLGQDALGRIELIGLTLKRLGAQKIAAQVVWASGQRAPNRVQVSPYGPLQ